MAGRAPLANAKRLASWLVAALSLTLAACAPIAPEPHKTISVTIVAGHPPNFLWVKHLKTTFIPTVDAALAERSNYRIRWVEAYGGTLAKVGGELETIEAGIADIGFNPSLFNPSKMPLQNVAFVAPFNSDDPQLITEIVEKMQEDIPQMRGAWEKYNQIYLGGGISIDPYHLWSRHPVRTLEDLRGRKIGAPGAAVNWVKGTGAVGVSGDLGGYYNAVKTGVYDGVNIFATAAAASALHEVAPYIVQVNYGTGFAGGITANQDFWHTLPEDVRGAMLEGVEAYKEAFYAEQENLIATAYQRMIDDGATIIELPTSERSRWAGSMPNVASAWANELDRKGLPGSLVLTRFMDELRQAGEEPPRDWDREHRARATS